MYSNKKIKHYFIYNNNTIKKPIFFNIRFENTGRSDIKALFLRYISTLFKKNT
jgi:hypothetical protein